tara:strand:+ start:810 stop:1553 length:744 start_codon:yes stop_codon:yes gene_type:complete
MSAFYDFGTSVSQNVANDAIYEAGNAIDPSNTPKFMWRWRSDAIKKTVFDKSRLQTPKKFRIPNDAAEAVIGKEERARVVDAVKDWKKLGRPFALVNETGFLLFDNSPSLKFVLAFFVWTRPADRHLGAASAMLEKVQLEDAQDRIVASVGVSDKDGLFLMNRFFCEVRPQSPWGQTFVPSPGASFYMRCSMQARQYKAGADIVRFLYFSPGAERARASLEAKQAAIDEAKTIAIALNARRAKMSQA